MNDDSNRDRRYPSEDGSGPGNDFHPAVEVLSEYLDTPADLAEPERDAIEGHLANCRECQTVLMELRLMVRTLSALPERAAPRPFALTPAMLEPAKTPAQPAPVVLRESAQWHARHASKVRWATAVAASLFVFVISADLVTNGLRGTTGSDDDSANDIVSVRQAEDSGTGAESYSQEEPASEPTTAAAQETPAAVEVPESESEDAPAQEEAQPESGDVPQEEEEAEAESEEAPDSESDAALTTQDDDEVTDDEDTSALSMETESISDEPQSEAAAQEDSSQMRWRIVEVTLALVLALLLAVMIGLPKQRGSRRR